MRKFSPPGLLRAVLLALILAACDGFWPWSPSTQGTFQRTYGGTDCDIGHSVAQTADGGYVIAGYTRSFGAGDWDVYLVKTDANGKTMWTQTYGGASHDESYSVVQTADGGYVIAGWTESFGAGLYDAWLIKTDANGDTMWTRTYGGSQNDLGYSVRQTADGGYVIAGWTASFGAGNADVWFIKTDAAGDTMWTRTYGGTDWDDGYSVAQTADGGYVLAGRTRSFGASDYDVWLIKTDASGDTVWTRTHGGTDHDIGFSVAQTTDGGYVVAGHTGTYGDGDIDAWLIKTDASGDTVWTRTHGGTDYDIGFSVAQTADGGYVIGGSTESYGAGSIDVWLIKTDASGDTMWTRTYGGAFPDDGYSVAQTTDGGYVITGSSTYLRIDYHVDVYLIKTDSAGRVADAEP